jgi:hypothetical protein
MNGEAEGKKLKEETNREKMSEEEKKACLSVFFDENIRCAVHC